MVTSDVDPHLIKIMQHEIEPLDQSLNLFLHRFPNCFFETSIDAFFQRRQPLVDRRDVFGHRRLLQTHPARVSEMRALPAIIFLVLALERISDEPGREVEDSFFLHLLAQLNGLTITRTTRILP